MPNPVAHFEIYGDNVEKLADFYRSVFGWGVDKVPGMDYWMVRTVKTDNQGAPAETGGINGGLMKRPMPDARTWVNYVSVKSLDESVKKLQSVGGTVIRSKSAVPKMGWFAVVADPEMNVFGIWQDDSNAA
jgi:predicted enzyme related to lactoylglutathione lyase